MPNHQPFPTFPLKRHAGAVVSGVKLSCFFQETLWLNLCLLRSFDGCVGHEKQTLKQPFVEIKPATELDFTQKKQGDRSNKAVHLMTSMVFQTTGVAGNPAKSSGDNRNGWFFQEKSGGNDGFFMVFPIGIHVGFTQMPSAPCPKFEVFICVYYILFLGISQNRDDVKWPNKNAWWMGWGSGKLSH